MNNRIVHKISENSQKQMAIIIFKSPKCHVEMVFFFQKEKTFSLML